MTWRTHGTIIAQYVLDPTLTDRPLIHLIVQTRCVWQWQAVLTQLIFDHALRMRVQSDAPALAAPVAGVQPSKGTTASSQDKGKQGKAKSGNFVGKLNNMVSTDLHILQQGQSYAMLCSYSSHLSADV